MEIAGCGQHACAVMRDGTVRCAGYNMNTHICSDDGDFFCPPEMARTIVGLTDIQQTASAHGYAQYALRRDGRLLRWGQIRAFARAPGLPTRTAVPELVPEPTDVVRIGGGDGDLLALKRDGTLWALHLPTEDGVPSVTRVPGFGPP